MPDPIVLSAQRPTEVRLSADGNRLFSADADGFVRVYDTSTGALLASWDVGVNLGGMDISPDGTFLVVIERDSMTTYRVDTATGASTAYAYTASGGESLFFDVAVLSNGKALFSQSYDGTGGIQMDILDYSTGVYSPVNAGGHEEAVLTRNAAGDLVLFGEPGLSTASLSILDVDGFFGNPWVTEHTSAPDYGVNFGVQAFTGALAAIYVPFRGIYVYDASLDLVTTIEAWTVGQYDNGGVISELTFSADGAWLYALNNEDDTIIKIRTSDWTVADTFDVGADVGDAPDYSEFQGGRLILDPQGRFFSVLTDTGLVLVANPDAPPFVYGTEGPDDLVGTELDDNMFGLGDNDELSGLDGSDRLDGGAGDDIIAGAAGNDVLTGGAGNDTMDGGAGDDTYYVDASGDAVVDGAGQGTDRLSATVSFMLGLAAEVELLELTNLSGTDAFNLGGSDSNNTIHGNAGQNFLYGNGGSDVLRGYGGDDFLVGGSGYDSMYGGLGNDTYYVDTTGEGVYEAPGEGFDRIVASASFTLGEFTFFTPSEIEVLEAADSASTTALDLRANNGSHTIYGNAGQNILDGGGDNDVLWGFGGTDYLVGNGGSDVMWGGAGDDTYYLDSTGDLIYEQAGEGFDRIVAYASHFLASTAEIELLEAGALSATDALDLGGNGFANTLYGNDGANFLYGYEGNDWLWGFGGADFLVGGTGNDVMYGGLGDDTYYVDSLGDLVYELADEGYDRVTAEISVTLSDSVEIEQLEAVNLTATTAMNLGGSNTVNSIRGNEGVNVINGFGGNDALHGFGGDDVLIGGDGNDTMDGGLGNDTYYVDNYDVVVDAGGYDRVAALGHYSLGLDVAIELLEAVNSTDTAPLVFEGSNSANTIVGNAGNNSLTGHGGNDTLYGYGGDDALYGEAGDDLLVGGTGNDTYVFVAAGDAIVEADGEGYDNIYVSGSYVLAANAAVELIEIHNPNTYDPIDLTGSDIGNTINGGNGNNVLHGGGGNDTLDGRYGDDTLYGDAGDDTLTGGQGNDIYFVDSAGDVVVETGGPGESAYVFTSVSYTLPAAAVIPLFETTDAAGTAALNLTGNGFDNAIGGNAGANVLSGLGGNDILIGVGGADQLVGGDGVDVLDGGAGSDTLTGGGDTDGFAFTSALGAGNIDQIVDFVVGIDGIILDDAVFTGLPTGDTLAPAAFRVGSSAADADDRIIYNSATGALFFDADGSGGGAQVQFATLTAGLALTADDFGVI